MPVSRSNWAPSGQIRGRVGKRIAIDIGGDRPQINGQYLAFDDRLLADGSQNRFGVRVSDS